MIKVVNGYQLRLHGTKAAMLREAMFLTRSFSLVIYFRAEIFLEQHRLATKVTTTI